MRSDSTHSIASDISFRKIPVPPIVIPACGWRESTCDPTVAFPAKTFVTHSSIVSEPVGVSSGQSINKIRREDRPAHDWYRFVLSFPPHLVREYVEKLGVRPHQTVLDPFCGTGTTLVECKKLGIDGIGIERNLVACFAARVKTKWDIDPDELLEHAYRVSEEPRHSPKYATVWSLTRGRKTGHPAGARRRVSTRSDRI